MTINTQELRGIGRAYEPVSHSLSQAIVDAADTIDLQTAQLAAQAAEIARLRGLVTEMTEHDTYETEYDGRMYSICHGCGAQDGEPHRDPNCLYVRARAALQEKSNG